jgi:hypothetical protein
MAGLEVLALVIGIAGLFSSCVDAFAYFKAAQRADEEVEIHLLKLDIEKTRLLIWGNDTGVYLSITKQHAKLRDEGVLHLLAEVLRKIEKLLSDSETLRSYGLKVQDSHWGKAIDCLSSKSFAIFHTSSSRFWTRNAARLDSTLPTVRGSAVPAQSGLSTKRKSSKA